MTSTTQTSILVPIDSTEQTLIALHQTYNLAKLTNSKIILLSVDEGEPPFVQNRLEELAKEASRDSGQPVETMMRHGNVYEEINKEADLINPIFIIIEL